MYFAFRIILTALIITTASELGKRSTVVASLLISLPLTSILALIWLYRDTGDLTKISEMSLGIFWAVLPSLLFFLILPFLLKSGIRFVPSLLISIFVMAAGYSLAGWLLTFKAPN